MVHSKTGSRRLADSLQTLLLLENKDKKLQPSFNRVRGVIAVLQKRA